MLAINLLFLLEALPSSCILDYSRVVTAPRSFYMDFPESDRQIFQDLLDLLHENEATDKPGNFPLNKPYFMPSLLLLPAIQVFFNTVYNDFCRLPTSQVYGQNLTMGERRALKKLKSNQNFLIKEADKGGNVVLWPTNLFVAEAKWQLDNGQYYQYYHLTLLCTLGEKWIISLCQPGVMGPSQNRNLSSSQ